MGVPVYNLYPIISLSAVRASMSVPFSHWRVYCVCSNNFCFYGTINVLLAQRERESFESPSSALVSFLSFQFSHNYVRHLIYRKKRSSASLRRRIFLAARKLSGPKDSPLCRILSPTAILRVRQGSVERRTCRTPSNVRKCYNVAASQVLSEFLP